MKARGGDNNRASCKGISRGIMRNPRGNRPGVAAPDRKWLRQLVALASTPPTFREAITTCRPSQPIYFILLRRFSPVQLLDIISEIMHWPGNLPA